MLSPWTLILINDEGVSFMTFVWRSLYLKGDNALEDEGSKSLSIVLPCSWFIEFENKWPTFAPTSGGLKRPPSTPGVRATTFVMPPKKAIAPGAVLAPLGINQEGLPLREARN
jgi:hypothetical protein